MGLSAANAQSSSTTVTTPASADSTTTTTVESVTPASAKKWGGSYLIEINENMRDQNQKGKDAKIYSINQVTANYQLTTDDKVGVTGQFEYSSVPLESERAATSADAIVTGGGVLVEGYNPIDPYIKWDHNFNKSLLGSDPVSLSSRYYLPVMEGGYQALGFNNGVVRFDAEIQWTLSKLVQVSLYLNPRVMFASSAETIISAREYGVLYLTFNDKVQFYQLSGVKTKVLSATEGRKGSEAYYGETGFNFTPTKNVLIQTYLGSEAPIMDPGTSGGIARAYSDENLTYALVTQVKF